MTKANTRGAVSHTLLQQVLDGAVGVRSHD
ncbi:quaternary amine uptake ABC transporter (QAT) family, ATP-binding protein [Klebsiella variicola]|uniref:Quaternary amine uptake ABC transporter (QAT) family, ATP-binding protein n=1 Tax=Klebsiella variicola TaxID=244366 RepID=A0A7H4MMP7_KLEVA|nr:quaternary amine uptake ABC transporter (QAT) family, ATP-binding protein [Klebsiella variicola]